jgi:exopolysaccharide biosynthesis predicted pyruvyltransferase EpsI
MTAMLEKGLTADALAGALRAGLGDAFAAAIPPGPVALVDFPDHSNVGDSAIWLGEMAWLKDNGRMPAYTAALKNFSAGDLLRAAPAGPILIHGGGNFGTTWPRHEALRLSLLRRFPGRPIVQLPQSIHYDNAEAAREMAQAIRAHGAFTLLVRDAKSRDFAERHFGCDVRLCPDAALYLGRLRRWPAKADILALLRTDHEQVRDDTAAPPGAISTDWLLESAAARRLMRVRVKVDSFLAASEQGRRLRRYQMLAHLRLQRGLAILSQGRVVVTDRLHAHILSLLLDIPHVALDNSYGKLSAFAEQWTANYTGFHRTVTRADAFELARALLGSAPAWPRAR